MSNLQRGMEIERVPDKSPLYTPPILLIAFSISSSLNEFPRIPSTKERSTLCSIGEPSRFHSRPSHVVTRTDSILPPRTESCKQTSISADSQARMSRPVTSMNKSRVFVVTVVWSPLIIGGNDSTASLESKMIGTLSIPSKRCA